MRILDAALSSFAARGYEATSLDALAGSLAITKQTILHHFGSKDLLLGAVLRRTVSEVALVIDESLARTPESGWAALETVVRAVFSLAGRRPELLGFLREAGRLGHPHDERLVAELAPLTDRATVFLSAEMATKFEARKVVLAAYAAVLGAVTEFEVLRQLGERPTGRLLLRRRRELLVYLSDLLGVTPTGRLRFPTGQP